MVALPSFPEMAWCAAPVCWFVTDTIASFTTAPDWSVTITTIVDVLGDCPCAEAPVTDKDTKVAETTKELTEARTNVTVGSPRSP